VEVNTRFHHNTKLKRIGRSCQRSEIKYAARTSHFRAMFLKGVIWKRLGNKKKH
jgi:hypothetical protein